MNKATALIGDVAEAYGIKTDDMYSRSRLPNLADARAIAAYMLTRHLWMSSTEAARLLRRNHATILHNVKKVEGMLSLPKYYAKEIAVIDYLKEKYSFETDKEDEIIETAEIAEVLDQTGD